MRVKVLSFLITVVKIEMCKRVERETQLKSTKHNLFYLSDKAAFLVIFIEQML